QSGIAAPGNASSTLQPSPTNFMSLITVTSAKPEPLKHSSSQSRGLIVSAGDTEGLACSHWPGMAAWCRLTSKRSSHNPVVVVPGNGSAGGKP
ncbi:hypothetical protein HaLaN_09289, partial [Haematococcus lacustris]